MTLVEMLVSLLLFAVIGGAGFAVLEQIIRVQNRTEGRLERLAELQRSMYILTQDFTQAVGGSVRYGNGAVTVRRGVGSGDITIQYDIQNGTLTRTLSTGSGGAIASQSILSGVTETGWHFLTPEGTWAEQWPVDMTAGPMNPVAVAVDLKLSGSGLSGSLRRVMILPGEVRP